MSKIGLNQGFTLIHKKKDALKNRENAMQGVVKWFSPYRGFGFIKSQERDYFVHKSDIEKNLNLDKGDKVSFEPKESSKGTKAIKVRKIS